MDTAILMDYRISKILLVLVITSLLSTCTADLNWYRGCYTLPYNGRTSKLPLRELSHTWTPEKCSKKCRVAGHAFAYLTSTSTCFCLRRLTQRVHDATCQQRCPLKTIFRCGGSRTASVYSVYGPYILNFKVSATPAIVNKNQDVNVVVFIELAHDSSTKSGIESIDRKSFRQAQVSLRVDGDPRTRLVRKIVPITGRIGRTRFNIKCTTEGRKYINVTVTNPVSETSVRRFVDVESRTPKGLKLELEHTEQQFGCTADEVDNAKKIIFVEELVIFRAEVKSGYNLTFTWNFCGRRTRVYQVAIQRPTCQLAQCKKNEQKFTFRTPGACKVEVKVSNGYDSATKSLLVEIVSPELKNLEVNPLPYEWEWKREVTTEAPPPPLLDLFDWRNIEEAIPEDRGSEGNNARSGFDYPSFIPIEQPKIPKKHIPLEQGQYLIGKDVYFEAIIIFLKNVGEATQIEIDFGDGYGMQHNLISLLDHSRMKRSMPDEPAVKRVRQIVAHDRKAEEDEYYNKSLVSIRQRFKNVRKRRSVNPIELVLADRHGPYGYPSFNSNEEAFTYGNDYTEMEWRDPDGNGIAAEYKAHCVLKAKFHHSYKKAGKYNVTFRFFDDTNSLFGGITEPIQVLNGTAELNIRCPEIAELGQSVVFSLSSTLDYEVVWNWKITKKSDSKWTQDEHISRSAFSLKKSFVLRGFYQIEVNSADGRLFSSCQLQVEEAISGLEISTTNLYVPTGGLINLDIQLESGTYLDFKVFSEKEITDTKIESVGTGKWTAKFRVYKADCYEFYIRAKNPVSKMKSNLVAVCVEEQISGLNINVPKVVDLRKEIPLIIKLESGSNVSLDVDVFSLANRKLHSYHKKITHSDEGGVLISIPVLTEPGRYRIAARGRNNVFARSATCEELDSLFSEKSFYVTNIIDKNSNVYLNRWRASRNVRGTGDDTSGSFIYSAKLIGKPFRTIVGEGILYAWSLTSLSKVNGNMTMTVSTYYSSSPLLTVSLDRCTSASLSMDAITQSVPADNIGKSSQQKCQVAVSLLSPMANYSASVSAVTKTPQALIIPHSGVIETKKSCEFDIKCPLATSRMCLVDFGDDSQPMRISANSYWNSLSHAFTEAGLHVITLSELGSQNTAKRTLYTTHVLVQEKIQNLELMGTSSLSHAVNAVGSWRVVSQSGTHKVYRWSISHANGTNIQERFTREAEYAYELPDFGQYILRVVVFNEISRQVEQMRINVEQTPWFFSIKTSKSVVGRPSSFIISTNASKNIVSAKFRNSSTSVNYDLSCLRPNGSYLDTNGNPINWYVITHKYNETGSYEATFSLLSKSHNENSKRLYTVKTEVLHKPEPKNLQISILSEEAVHKYGRYYIPTNQVIVMRASTNYLTKIFSWKIRKLDSSSDFLLAEHVAAANSSTSLFKYKFYDPGSYEILATAHPEAGQGNKTILTIEAEEMISKMWVYKPFSSKYGKIFESCVLKRTVINGTIKYLCDSLTLTAKSFGTHVTFFFYIHFREDIRGDYSIPNKVVDVIRASSRQTVSDNTNEASVEYIFSRQGVYYITAVASNNLGNKSAEISYEKSSDGPSKPFLFYAERVVPSVWFEDVYKVASNQWHIYKVEIEETKQVLDITWDMGEGTTYSGKSVNHTYIVPGKRKVIVTVKNRVKEKTISTWVSVQTLIQSVQVDKKPGVYSTRDDVNLTAQVEPLNSAVKYIWYFGDERCCEFQSNRMQYQFRKNGTHYVKVVVSNAVSSAESLPINVTIEEPIDPYFIGDKVVVRNRTTMMSVLLYSGSDVSIQWKIDDTLLPSKEFALNHTFTRIGVYYVHITLSNKLGITNLKEKIFVLDVPCQLPVMKITKDYQQHFEVSKSKPLKLEVDISIVCSFTAKANYEWKVWKVNFSGNKQTVETRGEEVQLKHTRVNSKVLNMAPGTLPYGNYTVTANISIDGTILYRDDDVRVNVHPSQPVAKIEGGKVQHMSRGSNVTINSCLSYDPDYLEEQHNITFDWECFVLFTPDTPCFKKKYLKDFNASTTPIVWIRPAGPAEEVFGGLSHNGRAMYEYRHQEPTDAAYTKFPWTIMKNNCVLNFPASWLIESKEVFVFKVKISTPQRPKWAVHSAEETVVIKMSDGAIERVKIHCLNCKSNNVPKQKSLQFKALCDTCGRAIPHLIPVKYRWSMSKVEDDRPSFYKNETSHCAPTDGEGWLSLIGPHSNVTVSDKNVEMSDFYVGLLFGNDTDSDDTSSHEDPNFYGNVLTEESLQRPWSMVLNQIETENSSSSGDVEEDNSYGRQSEFSISPSFRQHLTGQYDNEYDNAPYPGEHHRSSRSTQNPRDIFFNQATMGNSGNRNGGEPSSYGQGNDGEAVGRDAEESYGQHSRFAGYDRVPGGHESPDAQPPSPKDYGPTLSPHPEYLNSAKQPDGLIDDSAHGNDGLLPTDHYQGHDQTPVNLNGIAWDTTQEQTMVLRPDLLVEGKTYYVTVEVLDSVEEEILGKASYYFSVLHGPSYGLCSVLHRTENYLVHCAQWKNLQNDNDKDLISRGEMINYEVQYSLSKDGDRRHIYSGVSINIPFNLPMFDKPAYIHIVLRNSDGAATEVCSFLPEGPDRYKNATGDDFLDDAFNKSASQNSILSQMVAFADEDGIIALSNVILDTIPSDEYFHESTNVAENERKIKRGRAIVSNIISALLSIQPQSVAKVGYIIDTLSRSLERVMLVTTSSIFEAADLIIQSADSIQAIKASEKTSFDTYVFSDSILLQMLLTARLRLTESCHECAKRIQKANAQNFKLKILKDLFLLEKEVYARLDEFSLSLLNDRPEITIPLHAVVDEYGYVAQNFAEVIKIHDNNSPTNSSLGKWHVGGVFPDTLKKKLLSNQKDGSRFFTIASTMPDLTLSNYKTSHIEERPFFLTMYKEDLSESIVSGLSVPIIIALPPRKDDAIPSHSGILTRDRVAINSFPASRQQNKTLHIEISVESQGNRSFPVSIAITKKLENVADPPAITDIMKKIVLTRGKFASVDPSDKNVTAKFVMRDEDFTDGNHVYQVMLWNEQASTSRSRRFDAHQMSFSLKVWWSDCFYWNELLADWRQDGMKVLEESTFAQTLCSATHLSAFSASFMPVQIDATGPSVGPGITRSAFFAAFAILIVVALVVIAFLRITHGYKRRESFFAMHGLFHPRFNVVGRRLRWYFGPDNKSNVVPIILHDNRKNHEQVFELLVQTSCWLGSGTTSNVSIRIYGEDGKYDVRELITPKTHGAREARNENEYAEDDDYTGINDELFITGATTKFIVTFPESKGNIDKIVVWHDHSGEFPDWRIDYLTIRDVTKGRKYHFPCYKWISLSKGKPHSLEMTPMEQKPPFYQQVALKLHAFMCNFSSICCFFVAPGYGNLSRRQHVAHLICLFVVTCALSACRFLLELDIYSHDTELPYINSLNLLHGLIIGFAASMISVPAQLLFRFSKQDDKISVTIEDATESLQGSGFFEDYRATRYASSIDISKPTEEKEPHSTSGQDVAVVSNATVLSSLECDYRPEDDCHIPSVQDTVCDWLESKAESEGDTGEGTSSSTKYFEKAWNLPGSRSTGNSSWKQSISSIDEEIAHCMRTQSPLKRTQRLQDANMALHDNDNGEESKSNKPNSSWPIPRQGSNEIFTVSARLRKELDSMLQSGSLLAEQYAQMEGIYSSVGANMEIDAPDIVPCEKLEPIPMDFGVLLPKWSRKLAWIYYACIILTGTAFTLYACTQIQSFDIMPWLETVTFSVIGIVVVIEGSAALLSSVLTSVYDILKWRMSSENVWNLFDRVLCVNDSSTLTRSSTEVYIDSTTFHPAVNRSSNTGDSVAEDARIARELADRERSRYLRHAQPPTIRKSRQKKALKKRKLEIVSKNWMDTFFLLIMGITLACLLSQRFDELYFQSNDVETWLKETSFFPEEEKPLTVDMYEKRNESNYVLHKVKTKHDWVNWFNNTVYNSQNKSFNAEDHVRHSPSELLLRNNEAHIAKRSQRRISYILVGKPMLEIQLCKDHCYQDHLPGNLKKLLNLSGTETSLKTTKQIAAGVLEVQALLDEKPLQPQITEDIVIDENKRRILFFSASMSRGKLLMTDLLNKKEIFSTSFHAVLYNPSSNIYSHVTTSAEMLNGEETSTSEGFINTNVRSIILSYSPNHISESAYNLFFLSQAVLLILIIACIVRAIAFITIYYLGNIKKDKTETKNSKEKRRAFMSGQNLQRLLDFVIFILAVVLVVFSARQRSIIDNIMPTVYGYAGNDTTPSYNSVCFQDLIFSSSQLSSICGLLNFFIVMKILAILGMWHNFPPFRYLFAYRKEAIGQIFLLFLIYWTLVIILSFCAYLAFMGESSFSSFIKSIMTIVLSSVTFGNFPAQSSAKFAMIRAKFGTVVTLFFFLTIYITFRLVLKAFAIVAFQMLRKKKLSKKNVEKKEKKKDTKVNTSISFRDLYKYIWENFRYKLTCLLTILPFRNKSYFTNRYLEFTSLGFKSNSLTQREKKKLGYSSSPPANKPSPSCSVVEECKKDEEIVQKEKYQLPSEVWLSEIENQLDELYSRASVLAELAMEEQMKDDQDYGIQDKLYKDFISKKLPAAGLKKQLEVSFDSESDKAEEAKVEEYSDDMRTKISSIAIHESPHTIKNWRGTDGKSKQAIRKSSLSSKRKFSYSSRGIEDSGISSVSRNSTPGSSTWDKKSQCPMGTTKLTVTKALVNSCDNEPRKIFIKPDEHATPKIMLPERRYGWISDDDVLDRSSDISTISTSSFGQSLTPIPPLTARNLAKHNHHILSRQASSTTRSAKSSEKTVRMSDLPAETNTIIYETTPDIPETFTQRLWKRLISFSLFAKDEDDPPKVQKKARPLRRSRTAAINVKDIPKVNKNRHHGLSSSTSQQREGTKSIASTTKIRSMISSTKHALNRNYVQHLDSSHQSCTSSSPPLPRKTPSRVLNDEIDTTEDIETFSIPGTVPSSRSSPLRNARSATPGRKESTEFGDRSAKKFLTARCQSSVSSPQYVIEESVEE